MHTPKLLVYFPYDSETLTGGGRTLLLLMHALSTVGFAPGFITPRHGALSDALERRDIPVYLEPLPPSLNVYGGGLLTQSPLRQTAILPDLIRYNQRVANLARDIGAEFLIGRGVRAVLLVGIAAKLRQIPLIWDIGTEPASRGLVRLLHLLGLTLSDLVIMQAECQREAIFRPLERHFFSPKLRALLPGIDPDRRDLLLEPLPQTQPEDARTPVRFDILSVGTLHPRKNQLLLLEAFAPLAHQHPSLRLRLVGGRKDTRYVRTLEAFVDRHALHASVELLGWRDDVPSLMKQSDLLAVTSIAEGIPHVVREAMFARLPVVVTNVGGMPEIVEHCRTGYVVPSGQTDVLRDQLRHCITHPAELHSIAENAYAFAQDTFSIQRWARAYRDQLIHLGTHSQST